MPGGGWQYAWAVAEAVAEQVTHLPSWHVARRLAERERCGEAAARRVGDVVAARLPRRGGGTAAARPLLAVPRRGGEAEWCWLPSRDGEVPPSRCCDAEAEAEARPPPRDVKARRGGDGARTLELGIAEAGRWRIGCE